MVSKISYNSKEYLGEGSYGTEVFRGFYTDKNDKKSVAVKVIPSIKKEKYVDEFQLLVDFSKNKSHVNVVKYYHVDVISGPDLLIAIELCEITLEDFVDYKLGEEICMGVIRQLLDGLHFLHSNNITHGDLTPSNALLQKHGEKLYVLKLADFCMSRIIPSRWMAVAKSSSGIRTTEWMAPEILRIVQALDKNRKARHPQVKTTFSSDAFAVGCLIFYIVSNGLHPFGKMLRRESNILDDKKCLQFRKIGSFYWPVLFALCKMLDVSPQLRPSTFDIAKMSQFLNSTEDHVLFNKISTLISDLLIFESASENLMAQMNVFIGFINNSCKNSQTLPLEHLSLSTVQNIIHFFLTSGKSESKLENFESHHEIWLKDHFLSWKIMLVDSFWNSLDETFLKSKNDIDSYMIFLMEQARESQPVDGEITEMLNATHIAESEPKTDISFDRLINAAKGGSFVGYINIWRQYGPNLSDSEILKILQVTVQNSSKNVAADVQDRIRILEVLKSENSEIFHIKNANLFHLPNIHIEMLKHLLNQDANVFAQNNKGQTLLHLCPVYLSSAEYNELVNILFERDQYFLFRIPCLSGIYPLHTAVKMLEITDETLQLLYTRKLLSTNCIDNEGKNIFDIALCSHRSEQFLTLLQKYEIVPSPKSTQEQKALLLYEKVKAIEDKRRRQNLENPPLSGFDLTEVVGLTDEPSILDTVTINWLELARSLDTPSNIIQSSQRNILMGKLTKIEVVRKLLMIWTLQNRQSASLESLFQRIPLSLKPFRDSLEKLISKKPKCWNDLDADTKKNVLQTNVNILNRKFALSSFVELMDADKFASILNENLTEELLLRSLNNECWNLGNYRIPKPVPYYMQQKLIFRRKLDPTIFRHPCSDVFVFEGMQRYHLSILARPELTDVSSYQILKVTTRFILLEYPDDYEEITKIAQSPVHRIRHEDNVFYWLGSSGSCKIIKEFLKPDVEEISESTLIENMSTFNNRPVAICSSPGMGKSVLLANLANQMINIFPQRIILFLELHSLIPMLASAGPEIELTFVKEILVSSVTDNKLAKEIFLEIISNPGLVFEVFLDGFDEIPMAQLDEAKQFLKHLRGLPNLRIFITARSHMQNEIEDALDVISFNIAPFNQSDQLNYLIDFWDRTQNVSDHEKLSQFAMTILQSLVLIKPATTAETNEFAGTPLHCNMLAEVYGNQAKMYSNRDNFTFQNKNSLNELFTSFISFKFERIPDCDKKLLKTYHWKEALMLLFPANSEATQIVKALTKTVGTEETPWEKILNVGILEHTTDGPRFVHKTFAEYLLAMFIVEELFVNKVVETSIFFKFIIDSVFSVYETSEGVEISINDLERICNFIQSSDPWLKGDLNIRNLKNVLLCEFNLPPDLVISDLNDVLFTWLTGIGEKPTLDLIDKAFVTLGVETLVADLHKAANKGKLVFQNETVCKFLDAALGHHENVIEILNNDIHWNHDCIGLAQDFTQLQWKLLNSIEQDYQFLTQLLFKLYRDTSVLEKVLNMDIDIFQNILLHASRNGNAMFFKYICDTLKSVLGQSYNDLSFEMCASEGYTFERRPIHESIISGNYELFEYLIYCIGDEIKENNDLWLACFVDSWKNSPIVIRNKVSILRMLECICRNCNLQIEALQKHFPNGVNVVLLVTLYDLCDYVPGESDAAFIALSVKYFCKKDSEMDILVDWLLSKKCAHLLTHCLKYNYCMLNYALLNNVLKPETLTKVYREHSFFGIEKLLMFGVASKRSETIVKTLVKFSGDVNMMDEDNNTLLHWATYFRKFELIKYLILVGGNVNAKNIYGNSPLYTLFQNIDSVFSPHLIHDIVSFFLTKKADVDAKNMAGLSAFQLAMYKRDKIGVEERTLELLRKYVNTSSDTENVSSEKGTAALITERDLRIIRKFDFLLFTFIDTVFCKCSERFVRNIVAISRNVNISDNHNVTLLHYASLFGEQKTMKYLLSKGADGNSKDNSGNTPLHYIFDWDMREQSETGSSMNKNTQWIYECVELLLKHDADVTAKNNKGITPLELAQKQKGKMIIDDQTFKLLLQNF